MSTIPKPVVQEVIAPDPSSIFLQVWKKLFNDIDPENIEALIDGDEKFPGRYKFAFNESRLSDSYNIDVQLFISLKGFLFHAIGGDICCCLRDTSFCIGWICELDENLDTFRNDPITWKEMYTDLVTIVKANNQRIPVPPKIE
jgi:hypothetical protein